MPNEKCPACKSVFSVDSVSRRARVKIGSMVLGTTRRCPKCEAQLPRVPAIILTECRLCGFAFDQSGSEKGFVHCPKCKTPHGLPAKRTLN